MHDTQIRPPHLASRAPLQFQTNPPRRILVVDDDPYLRHLTAEILLQQGYEVNAAEDGIVAWQALNDHRYDLMITDNQMPNLTGVALLKKLRLFGMVLPVILASGTFPMQGAAANAWLEPDATLRKPYTPELLLRTVKKLLNATDHAREDLNPWSNGQRDTDADGLQPGW